MKTSALFISLFLFCSAIGQNKNEIALLENARLLNSAVFVQKDSLVLSSLFSDKLSYGHSGGKVENRSEAIRGILSNQSMYTEVKLSETSVWTEDKTAVTRYTMQAIETKKDGTAAPLKINILLVWVKMKGSWKLLARQAVKLAS